MANNTTYYLLGHEVDKKTYDKYGKEKFSFMNALIGLDAIHLWATDEEIARTMPTQAAEAKRIIAEIEAEITGKPSTPGSGFNSIFVRLEAIHKDGRKKSAELRKAVAVAEQEYDRVFADNTANQLEKEYASVLLRKARADYESAVKSLKTEQADKVAQLRKELDGCVSEYYMVIPGKLDASAVQLINSGIMNHKDLEHMANQFIGNPTMLKLIAQAADKKAAELSHPGDSTSGQEYRALKHSISRFTDPKEIYDGFDGIAQAVRLGIHQTETVEAGWDKFISENMETVKNICAEIAPAVE